jgi:hypothetical protein
MLILLDVQISRRRYYDEQTTVSRSISPILIFPNFNPPRLSEAIVASGIERGIEVRTSE